MEQFALNHYLTQLTILYISPWDDTHTQCLPRALSFVPFSKHTHHIISYPPFYHQPFVVFFVLFQFLRGIFIIKLIEERSVECFFMSGCFFEWGWRRRRGEGRGYSKRGRRMNTSASTVYHITSNASTPHHNTTTLLLDGRQDHHSTAAPQPKPWHSLP